MKRLDHAKRLLKHYTSSHPALKTSQYPHQEPLLNFLELFIQAIDRYLLAPNTSLIARAH